ncbi:IS30 family transposase, partial [Kocuria sp. NPDC057446]|uniref:IS30 family transposase n=1 Tax=Kocuria sp. NPDC057446 TaxID=3346137 RepID=UPI003682381D
TRQGDLSHTRHPRVIETLRQPRNHPPQQRKEGDLILGTLSGSAIGTLVERATRYVTPVHLAHDHTAETVQDGLIASVNQWPPGLRRSLTWDQGAEMSHYASLRRATGIDVFFCDAASPWQRGSNENMNGLLRQYFPKSTNLSAHTVEDLHDVARELNSRPRKSLGWATPTEPTP